MPDVEQVLGALLQVARPIILTEFRRDSCIACTRVTVDALRVFGVEAKPLSVACSVWNPDSVALLSDGCSAVEVGEAAAKIGRRTPGGPWCVGVGIATPEEAETTVGHVVAYLPREHVLVDLSIDQADRPHKDIVLQPLAFDAGPDFDTRLPDEPRGVFVNGSLLSYTVDPYGRRNWLRSPNWKGGSETRRVTGRVVRAMREVLADEPARPTVVLPAAGDVRRAYEPDGLPDTVAG